MLTKTFIINNPDITFITCSFPTRIRTVIEVQHIDYNENGRNHGHSRNTGTTPT